jgi:putative methanogenesis marker protein 3
MKVTVNGSAKELKDGATLGDALKGEFHVPGTVVSVHLSTERVTGITGSFEMMTAKGIMTLTLDGGPDSEIWRSMIGAMKGSVLRWVTANISAFGSFRTDIRPERKERMYRRYDCFFSLGGMDNDTTYMMIAAKDHKGTYGAGDGRIGRITRGRHILKMLREGDTLTDIRPVMSEHRRENVIMTADPGFAMEDGMSVDSYVEIGLDPGSPMTAEHILVAARHGHMTVSDVTGSYAACSDSTDVTLKEESPCVRDRGSVTVRNTGAGTGKIFFYRERRQTVPQHSGAGKAVRGMQIISNASAGDRMTVRTDPERIMTVGMTQAAGKKFLESRGIKQIRTGDVSDDALITEQEPDWTMNVIAGGESETFGVPKEKVFRISLDRKNAPGDVRYFERITGLDHRPIGTMKVQFTFEGMPLITFEGDEDRGRSLYPQEPFKKCRRGDIGVTNQARPQHGLVGIRLQDSKEFGPTGEEPYGTNIFGRFEDIGPLMKEINDGDIVYVKEERT